MSYSIEEIGMKLKNILIVVDDIATSKKFYKDLFGLECIRENDGNAILTEGLVLQDKKVWSDFLTKDVIMESNSCLLYFEEHNMDAFAEKLERLYPDISYLHKMMTGDMGQKIIRFYDLDGNLIEIRNPIY